MFIYSNDSRKKSRQQEISIAFCGNSMLYFNDTPRLVQQMMQEMGKIVYQDSCLRGGASLPSLLKNGNGMAQKFASEEAKRSDGSYDTGAPSVQELLTSRQSWDFVVCNDYTQAPARSDSIAATTTALSEQYAPLFLKASTGAVVLIQTPAYRVEGIKDSQDLGSFEEMTNLLAQGLQSYQQTLEKEGIEDCRIAPVGEAYRYLHAHSRDLWRKLYSWDDFHPSPFGTWLQACVIFCTCFPEEAPPVYNAQWWEQSRYMQPPDEKPLPLPTLEEASELRRVASLVCGVGESKL